MLDGDTRQRVLEAAGPIFAAKGFEPTSIREICERAGANVSAVNYHFRNKEQLYVETVRYAYESVAQRVPLPVFPPGMPARQRLDLFVHNFLSRMEQPEMVWHCDLMMREVGQPTGGACANFVRDFVRPTFNLLMSILDDLVPPHVSHGKRTLLAGSIVGQCLHHHHSRHVTPLLIGPDDPDAGRDIAVWAQHVTEFSLAALERMYPHGRNGDNA